ncbi:MAG: hypothetical protein ACXWXS_04395 [Actinomycetota bacterium]
MVNESVIRSRERAGGIAEDAHLPHRGLTMDHVWAALTVFIPVIVSLLSRMVAIDLAYHVRVGLEMLDRGALVRTDFMTFTVAGDPWVNQQWGAQLIFALTHRAGGWAALAVLGAALIGASFGILYLACRQRGAAPRPAALLTLGGYVLAMPTMAYRPQLLVVPMFCLTLWALAGRADHPRRLWMIPVLALAWANLHGSFFLVPSVVGLAWLEDWRTHRSTARTLLAVGIVSVLATFVTPFGPGVWTYVVDLSTNPVVRNAVSEWEPTSLSGYAGATFFLSALGVAAFLARRGKPTPWWDLAWLAVFFLLALPAIRGMLWWGLVVPVVLAGLLPRSVAQPAERRGNPLMNKLVVGSLCVGVVVLLPWWRAPDEARQVDLLLREAPQPAVAAVREAVPPGSRLVVPQPWGSWFEYALPDMPLFVDPRIEIFPTDVWYDYQELRSTGAGWRDVLDRWRADAIVVDLRDWTLQDVLEDDPGWRQVFEDDESAVFVRT